MKVIPLLCALATIAAAGPAEDNEAGKQAMFAGQFATAVVKFRAAAEADPHATYYFNLCAALYSTGEFRPALFACQRVAGLKPAERLRVNTGKLIDKIKFDAKNQHISLAPEPRH
jgi:Flp pilus assembly protein TadD